MPEKKNKPTIKSLPPKRLSSEEAAKVKGGMAVTGGAGAVSGGGVKLKGDPCAETQSTGIKGCPA